MSHDRSHSLVSSVDQTRAPVHVVSGVGGVAKPVLLLSVSADEIRVQEHLLLADGAVVVDLLDDLLPRVTEQGGVLGGGHGVLVSEVFAETRHGVHIVTEVAEHLD